VAKPTSIRQTLINDFVTRLDEINGGTDYNHTLTVTKRGRPLAKVDTAECPWVWVGCTKSKAEARLSMTDDETHTVFMLIYVRPDEARWAGKGASELAEQVIADIIKKLDLDPSHGDLCSAREREIDATHSTEDDWSVVLLTDTHTVRREF